MPFIKERTEGVKKIFVCEYKSRDDARKDKCLFNEQIFEVHDLNKYIQQIDNWNLSQDRIKSGKVFEKEKPVALNTNIDYDRISKKGNKLISKALSTNNESDWMLCLIQHNKEQWSSKEYCCSGQIEFFKSMVQKLQSNGLGF